MKTTNSRLQTSRQRPMPMNSLLRIAVFISCLGLLLGVTVPFETAANQPLLPAPQSAPPGEVNRIERAATPRAFTSLTISNNPGPANLNLNGHIILGEQSDGIEPTLDRLVLALGSDVVVLEPGSLRPSGQSNRVWTYQDSKNPRVRKVNLQRNTDRDWQFEISASPISGNQKLYLRLGNDWGGIDLGTGQLLLQMQPALDWAFQAQATIGSGGGTVQTTNAAGVVIRLEVPPGALAQDTLITMTPLASSPLVASSKAISPGIKFEPEGLQFAEAATLTLDFSGTTQQITNKDFIFLLTSPMTMLPLYGEAKPATRTLTAQMRHFSELQPGEGNGNFTDLRAWADSVLGTTGNLTLSEMESLVRLVRLAQVLRIDSTIDLAAITRRVQTSIDALVARECPLDTTDPSEEALRRYIQLEAIAQGFGAHVTIVRPCIEQVLRTLMTRVGDAAIADPSEANRARLVALIGTAQALGFADIETLGLQKMDAALRTLAARLLARAQQAGGTPNEAAVTQEARTELEEVLLFVNTDGAALQSVDPALASYLQAAINSLGGINFTVARIFVLTCGRSVVSPFSPFSAIPRRQIAAPPRLPVEVGRGLQPAHLCKRCLHNCPTGCWTICAAGRCTNAATTPRSPRASCQQRWRSSTTQALARIRTSCFRRRH